VGGCATEGAYVCAADGLGTRCDAVPSTGTPEVCNGVDDDCDGTTDESTRAATVTVGDVHTGDPSFDYSTCVVRSGGVECMASDVTIRNTGAEVIPATARAFIYIDGSTPLLMAGPLPIGRTLNPGQSTSVVVCWDNSVATPNTVLRVEVKDESDALSCLDAVGTRVNTDFGICGDELCDGIDNNADSRGDEGPDACINSVGNGTQECIPNRNTSDPDDYVCVTTQIAASTGCSVHGCGPGSYCGLDDTCVTGCISDADCGGPERCELGTCVHPSWRQTSTPTPDAGAAPDASGTAGAPAEAGCSVTAQGATLLAWLAAGFGLVMMRRRRRGA
jgi:hypothetical protein